MGIEKVLKQREKVTTEEILENLKNMLSEDTYFKATGYTWYELIQSKRRLAALSSRSQLLVGYT